MRRYLLALLLCGAAFPQNPNTASFPSAILTDQVAAVAKDRSTSTLDASIDADDLTVTVASGDGEKFSVGQIITIEDEQMQICAITGDDLTICSGTRGFYASGRGSWAAAVSHSNGVAVDGNYGAYHLNQANAEIKAIQTLLKVNGAGVLRTDADSTTDAETTITFTPGATKPGAVFACGSLPASPVSGTLHCNSGVSNHPYWNDGSTWYDLLQSFTGIANRGFERTGVNFSINQGTHGYDHANLIVLLFDYDTGKEIKHPIYVQPVAPYAVTLDGDLPASRHMRVVIAGWGGPSGSASPHDMLSATHQDTAGAASPVLGGLLYANATPKWAQLAGNTTTTPMVLRQTGTGSASAVPTWGQVTSAYVDSSIITTALLHSGGANFNIFVGNGAGNGTQSGTSNTGVGALSLASLTSAYNTTAVGYMAGNAITSNSQNTIIGSLAAQTCVDCQTSTIIGFRALGTATANPAVSEVVIGQDAMTNYLGGAGHNVCVGVQCGYDMTTGHSNILLGVDAGRGFDLTGAYRFIAGGNDHPMDNVWFGKGQANATPTAYTINGTGGLGTDVAGADLKLAAGRGTGTGASGTVILQTATVGSTGSSLNSLQDALKITDLRTALGSSVTPQANTKLTVNHAVTTDLAANSYGAQTISTVNTAQTGFGVVYGSRSTVTASNSTGTQFQIIGLNGQASKSGAGGLTYLIGSQSEPTNTGNGAISLLWGHDVSVTSSGASTISDARGLNVRHSISAGTMTSWKGINVDAMSITGSGAVTNAYGLYLGNISGAGTANYGIYSAGGANYLAGGVDIASGSAYKINGSQISSADLSNSSAIPLWVSVPATATDACTAGQMARATGFLYVCIATNTWERAVTATW